jgi:N-methylhydantoinase B
VELRINGQWKTDFPNAKVLVAQLKPGDAFKIRSGGGGGYGSPLERLAEQVAEDVRQGYVTVKAAAELYGVVVDPGTFELDVPATEQLRVAKHGENSADAKSAYHMCGVIAGLDPAIHRLRENRLA